MLILSILYTIIIIFFLIGFLRSPRVIPINPPLVSVVIAACNEEDHLPALLDDLRQQEYPHFEVIIVNDRSTDHTPDILKAAQKEFPQLRWLTIEDVPQGVSPKKNALNQAIAQATGKIICTTDADCRVGKRWIMGLIRSFDEETGAVIGFTETIPPVNVSRRFFDDLQAMDFLAMITAARGVVNLGNAFAASGRNLAYRKAAFEAVGGFQEIFHRLSGDDVLLLQLIRQRTSYKIRFADDPDSYNATYAEKTFQQFWQQRVRWASNSTPQIKLNPLFFAFLVMVAVVSHILFYYPFLSFWVGDYWRDYLILLGVKFLVDGLLCLLGGIKFRQLSILWIFPLWFILHIPYVVIVGVMGIWGRFRWKGTKNW